MTKWGDWDAYQRRLGDRFLAWAEPAPRADDEERYAVIVDHFTGGIVWARVSPNPDVSAVQSSGQFYDDMEGGAIEAAKRAAVLNKERVRKLVNE